MGSFAILVGRFSKDGGGSGACLEVPQDWSVDSFLSSEWPIAPAALTRDVVIQAWRLFRKASTTRYIICPQLDRKTGWRVGDVVCC